MTKTQLRKAILASDKREEKERRVQERLSKQLVKIIAKEKGIVVGREYYVLPTPGRRFRATVLDIGRYWTRETAKDGENISVLVKFWNSRGAFKSQWMYTSHNEFEMIPVSKNGAGQ
jgi:hypothetical protein